ncbi:ejaculatory bulb-specific protein 3-like [Topomyia yanbarensis]|uniref:ejaculatory bulb-specific protein 3-like n=1 Tax=Topomyia yanbarensis TaxID=2498891 RepID=UPI00273AA31E|nr:ejaculatory bulb-specific protein 3-like [Topomyia yanbarensis]XP_058821013.1 ejaculatory bulb-specific protein 3-like [Topomyia yanbarensis]XP_058821014.1 ejaculatory bulb-specific protein 3-like [Topomyia yanbarensis]
MKSFIVISLALIVVVTAQNNRYTSKYDGIDIDEILKSNRLFNNYYKCLLDQGRCTPDANELKRILPEALQTNCEKCTEKQRKGAVHVINYLIENRSSQWKVLQQRYDPGNVYITKYQKEARASGIKI